MTVPEPFPVMGQFSIPRQVTNHNLGIEVDALVVGGNPLLAALAVGAVPLGQTVALCMSRDVSDWPYELAEPATSVSEVLYHYIGANRIDGKTLLDALLLNVDQKKAAGELRVLASGQEIRQSIAASGLFFSEVSLGGNGASVRPVGGLPRRLRIAEAVQKGLGEAVSCAKTYRHRVRRKGMVERLVLRIQPAWVHDDAPVVVSRACFWTTPGPGASEADGHLVAASMDGVGLPEQVVMAHDDIRALYQWRSFWNSKDSALTRG